MMKFDDKKFLAHQIKLHRKKLGITQAELAEKVDLSVQHISRIESGCYIPSLKSFFMIANALQIDLKIFGYNLKANENQQKEKLIQRISNASDAEIIFYENSFNAINKSLEQLKQKIL